MPPALCPTCQGKLDLVGRCPRCRTSIADRPSQPREALPANEAEPRTPRGRSLKLPAVDQPIIPPRAGGRQRPTAPVPVWKRELTSGIIFVGVMGTLSVITGLVGWYFMSRFDRHTKPADDRPELERLLEDLAGLDAGKRQRAAEQLSRAEPNHPRRTEVAQALARCLKDRDRGTAERAARALVAWATPEVVPDLAAALPGESGGLRNACLDALLPLKDPRAAEGVARCLPTGERGKAREVLEAIGPGGQGAVSPYLTHKDRAVRREACLTLKQIGTRDSEPALKEVEASDRDRGVRREAAVALKAILARAP